jgi:hypothetical protein
METPFRSQRPSPARIACAEQELLQAKGEATEEVPAVGEQEDDITLLTLRRSASLS